MLLFLGKKTFTVSLTFARVPEDATEAVTVHSSVSQPGPYAQRLKKVLVPSHRQHANAYTVAASVLAPAWLKTWLDLV